MSACVFCTNPGPITLDLEVITKPGTPDTCPSIATLQFLCQLLDIDFDSVFCAVKEPVISLCFCNKCEKLFRNVQGIYCQVWNVFGSVKALVLESNSRIGSGSGTPSSPPAANFFGGTAPNSETIRKFRRQICASRRIFGEGEKRLSLGTPTPTSPTCSEMNGIENPKSRKRSRIEGEDEVDVSPCASPVEEITTLPIKKQKITATTQTSVTSVENNKKDKDATSFWSRLFVWPRSKLCPRVKE